MPGARRGKHQRLSSAVGSLSWPVHGRHYVVNFVANLSQRLVPLRQAVEQMVGLTFCDDQTSVYHHFQVSLKRPAVDIGA